MSYALIGGALALALLLATPAAATQYSLDFTDESGLMAFLEGTRNVAPWGISYVVSHDLATNGAQIHANGYKIKTYITGGIAENFQGYPNAKYVAYIQNVISSMVKPIGDATGADTLLVNELNVAPGEASLNTPASIAYNVAGLNLARKFIRSINPSVKFGLSLAGSYQGAQSCLLMLQAGLDIDVCQGESYLQSGEGATNPFVSTGLAAQFPNVETGLLVYGSWVPLCNHGGAPADNWIQDQRARADGPDYIGVWNPNNDTRYFGPQMDAQVIQTTNIMALTGQKPFCSLPFSLAPKADKITHAPPGLTIAVNDVYEQLPGAPNAGLSRCEYLVQSGANAGIGGPGDTSITVTRPWSARTCNAPLTVTIGPGADCRDAGSDTCQVFLRAWTADGLPGNASYVTVSVSY